MGRGVKTGLTAHPEVGCRLRRYMILPGGTASVDI
jgi:hypothetical protein